MKKLFLFAFLSSVFAEITQQEYHSNFNENNSFQEYSLNEKTEYEDKFLESTIKPTEFSNLEKIETLNYEKENLQYKQISDTQYVKNLINKKKNEKRVNDWRKKGIIQKIKDQNPAGTCWLFAGISNVESHFALKKRKLYNLSEQEILDCLPGINEKSGGTSYYVYDYINQRKGIYRQTQYRPYKAKKMECRNGIGDPLKITRLQYKSLYNVDEELIKDFISLYGPVVTRISVVQLSSKEAVKRNSNEDGIIIPDSKFCSVGINHEVNIIGYGTGKKTRVKYWLVRNSWGEDILDKGYFKIIRGRRACHIGEYIYYISSIEGEYFKDLDTFKKFFLIQIIAAAATAIVFSIITIIVKKCKDSKKR